MGGALGGVRGGWLAARFATVDAAIMRGVGVHDFAIEARLGNAETIALADDRRSVDDRDNEVFGFLATADERKNTVVGVVGVDPFETVPVKVDLMERGFGGVKVVEIADKALDAAVGIVLEQVPIQAVSFTPFVALGEFLTHEEQFFARVDELKGVEQTEIGELLPHVAGHFVEKRVFSVDDFVVGEGKQKVFGKGVEEREGEFVMFVLTMHGIVGKIF